jgi:hypothetical protein
MEARLDVGSTSTTHRIAGTSGNFLRERVQAHRAVPLSDYLGYCAYSQLGSFPALTKSFFPGWLRSARSRRCDRHRADSFYQRERDVRPSQRFFIHLSPERAPKPKDVANALPSLSLREGSTTGRGDLSPVTPLLHVDSRRSPGQRKASGPLS